MNVEEKVKEIIAEHIGIPTTDVELNSYLHDDLNTDPLTIADLIVRLEDEFKLEIPAEESLKFEKVEDIVNYVADKIGEV